MSRKSSNKRKGRVVNKADRTYRGIVYASGFEKDIAKRMYSLRTAIKSKLGNKVKITFEYEKETLPYILQNEYNPDWTVTTVTGKKIILEGKGKFDRADRRKMLCVRDQHPELDIRFVFQYNGKLQKGAVSRYSDWCELHGFKYAFGTPPQEWFEE